jgi:hypothetical protein
VFVLIAVVAGVIWAIYSVYRREIDTCPVWVKIVLATLRTAVCSPSSSAMAGLSSR